MPMKTAYEPDNTRSSIVILVSLGIIVSVIVAIFGLSDKPEVSTIAVAPGADFDVASVTTSIVTEAPRPDIPTTDADATEDSVTEDEGEAEREVIVVPTLEPTATPEVAAAVEPTAVPDAEETTDSATGEVIPAASLPTSSDRYRVPSSPPATKTTGQSLAKMRSLSLSMKKPKATSRAYSRSATPMEPTSC